MLADTMKRVIEENTLRIQETSPLLVAAREGRLTQDELVTYLHNLMYFFQHTPIYLKRAALRAEELDMPAVAAFMKNKIGEEAGHDNWAKQDLKKQNVAHQQPDPARITRGTQLVLDYARDIIDRNPELYLSYMTFTEYFTVLAAPQFLDDLEKKCGIPRGGMTAVGNHGELDKDHIEDDLVMIGQIADPAREPEMLEALRRSIELIEQFFSECVTSKSH